MSVSKASIIIVIVIFTFVLVGIVLYTSRTNTPPTTPLPSPVQESTDPTATPTPSEQTIEGEIVTMATSPIGFKNSYVVTVERTDGTSALIYVTGDTTIQNVQGNEVTRTSLRAGTRIIVVAAPAEGGFEAVQIQISPTTQSTTTVVPTRNVPTTTPEE